MLPSIPYVLARDSFRRGISLHFFLIGIVLFLPTFLMSVLRAQGVESDDPSVRTLLFHFMVLNGFVCSATGAEFLTVRPRTYSLPLTTTKLVACQIIPAMLVVCLNMMFLTSVENLIFTQTFPLWGPACFAALAIEACWATYWYTNRTIWQLFALLLVAGSIRLTMPHFWNLRSSL